MRRVREDGILFTVHVSGCLLSTAVTRIRLLYKSMTQNSGPMTMWQEKF